MQEMSLSRFDTAEKRKSGLDENIENTRLKCEGGKMNRNYIHDYKIKHMYIQSPKRDEVENGGEGGKGEAQFDEVMTKNVPKVIKT